MATMDDSGIAPGSPVRTEQGDFGVVERVIADPSGVDVEALVVRAEPDGGRYHVPVHLIAAVRTEDGQDVVYLSDTGEPLERRATDPVPLREPPQDDPQGITGPAAVPGSQQGSGLRERLQAGIDSLTSGVRGALEGVAHRPDGPDAAQEELALRVPVVEERIVTQAEPVRVGTLRVHKTVDTAEETITVPVTHEEPEVDYVPVEEYDPKAPYQPGETYIPIMGEKLVVEKRQVVTGYLRVRKRLVSTDRQVTETVRREHVAVEQDMLEREGEA
jgi:uncharacterized protein (TIGR02271 family)